MHYRRYLMALIAGTGLLAAGVTGFNLAVDPLDVWRLVERPGFNANKSEYQSFARVAKPIQIERFRPERLAFGSSRIDLAMPMEYGAWAREFPHGFNAGLNASNLQTVAEVLEHAAAVSTVRDVLIGIDFYMFNGANQTPYLSPDMITAYNPVTWQRRFAQGSLALFSPSITRASISTVRNQDAFKRKPTGQAVMQHEINTARRNGYRRMFERYEDGMVRHVWTPCRDNRFAYRYGQGPDTMVLFERILTLAEQEGFRLTLFIAPVHVRSQEMLHASGLWPDYEQWQRDLLARIKTSPATVRLWNFRGYHAYAQEAIPDDPDTEMRWYIDSSHYTEALAERLLDAMYGDQAVGFGARLHGETIEAFLAARRAERDAWQQQNPDEHAALRQRAEALLAEKQRSGRRCAPALSPSEAAASRSG